MIQYWSGLPDYVFNKDCLTQNWLDANMLKGGITYCNRLTTVSNTYAGEIQTEEYGEVLRAKGIVQGTEGNWIEFDYVPQEYEIRDGHPDYTGKICVIGTKLNEEALDRL